MSETEQQMLQLEMLFAVVDQETKNEMLNELKNQIKTLQTFLDKHTKV